MTKLIVQIPCFNEEATIVETIRDIPRAIDGVETIEILVIDDGSSDQTVAIAKANGADHIISNGVNRGLAISFQRGIDHALKLGADIIVNTDGDNQYFGADIAKLVAPIVGRDADIVIGDRQTSEIEHFSPLKKFLQRAGSSFVRRLSGAGHVDAVSGFRAFSREAAMRLTVRSTFSYTIETLIQAGKKNLIVKSVPVRTNKVDRPSRLFRSIPHFLMRSGRTMLRVYAMYEPLKIFLAIGIAVMLLGSVPIARFLINYLAGNGAGMIQSLIIGGSLFIVGAMSVMFALIADLIAYNRQLLEVTLERVRRIECDLAAENMKADGSKPADQKRRNELESLKEELAAGLRS